MTSNPLVLTFDIGTQSARAMLVDSRGSVVCKAQQPFETPYLSPQPGWAEQDPDMYWKCLCTMSRKLKAENEALWADIIAVTCTCIRATTVCLDRQGRPLRSAIVWLDKRVAEDLPPMPAATRFALTMIGMTQTVETIRGHMACNWIIRNQPEIWAKTDKYVLLSAYLNLRFTGVLADSTANTVGVVPFDTQNGRWLSKKDFARSVYLLEDDKLVDLVQPGDRIGAITREAAEATGIPEGTPYIVTGADKACETLGLSCTDETSAALSFGTTATVEIATKRYVTPAPLFPPYTAIYGGYLPEVETFRGYWLLSWFSREFAAREMEEAKALGCSAEELLNKRLKEIPPGCDGLVFQPSFTPDMSTPHAKGAVIGFSDVHTRIHLYRSIIEGINFSLMEGLYQLEKRGKFKVKKLFVAGGGSRSDEICQITANMFGLPVNRTQTHEVSGLGSSLTAFVSMGVYGGYPDALKNMVHVKDVFQPDIAEQSVYIRLYEEIYRKVFENLAPLYEKLDGIIHTRNHAGSEQY
jgi:sugar (pentulose or hexulose) kinase